MIPESPALEDLPFRARVLQSAGIGAVGLLLANAGLLVLYFVLDLSLYELLVVYWWEMLWIGVFSALKLLVASAFGDPFENRHLTISKGSNVIFSALTIWWCGAAFLTSFAVVGALIFLVPLPSGADALHIDVERGIRLLLQTSMILFCAHGLSFVVNFLFYGEFRSARAATLIALPFRRCIALLVSIVIAGMVMHVSSIVASATAFAVAIMILKLVADYRLYYSERARFAADRK